MIVVYYNHYMIVVLVAHRGQAMPSNLLGNEKQIWNANMGLSEFLALCFSQLQYIVCNSQLLLK